jgi:hypothetical protein
MVKGGPSTSYRIRIKKGDSEIEAEGDKGWVDEKIKELTSEKLFAPIAKEPSVQAMPQSLGEFLELKGNPQKHTELIAVFAYWLLKAEKTATFDVKDIISCYDKTRRVKPSNPNQIINTNVRYNLFSQAGEKKDGFISWFLTDKGEKLVESLK